VWPTTGPSTMSSGSRCRRWVRPDRTGYPALTFWYVALPWLRITVDSSPNLSEDIRLLLLYDWAGIKELKTVSAPSVEPKLALSPAICSGPVKGDKETVNRGPCQITGTHVTSPAMDASGVQQARANAQTHCSVHIEIGYKMIQNPDFAWYIKRSKELGLTPRCPIASAELCPRHFATLSLFGKEGIITDITHDAHERLEKK